VLFENAAVRDMLGYADLVGTTLVSIVHPDDEEEFSSWLDSATIGRVAPNVSRWRLADGDWRYWSHWSSTCETIRRSAAWRSTAATSRGTSASKTRSAPCFHDALTDLREPRTAARAGEQAVKRAERHNTQLALLFVDLDDFSASTIVSAMRAATGPWSPWQRDAGLVANERHGRESRGDEFVILLDDIGSPAAAEVAARRVLLEIEQPMSIQSESVQLTASVGIAMLDRRGMTVTTLQHLADLAMYQAKAQGKGRAVMAS